MQLYLQRRLQLQKPEPVSYRRPSCKGSLRLGGYQTEAEHNRLDIEWCKSVFIRTLPILYFEDFTDTFYILTKSLRKEQIINYLKLESMK